MPGPIKSLLLVNNSQRQLSLKSDMLIVSPLDVPVLGNRSKDF